MVKVACIQINSNNDVIANIARASALIRDAHNAGAEFILTPECVGLMAGNREETRRLACPEDQSRVLKAFSTLAQDLNIWLLLGSAAIRPEGEEKIRNRSFLINPQGAVAARYDKIHMYDANLPNGLRYCESECYSGGEKQVLAPLPWGTLGMTICYDVRFPHLFRSLAKQGADFITVPAAFVRFTGQAHWEVLLRARAIENGCYIFAPAQTGDHPAGRQTFGHAMIIDPWGEVLADAGTQEGFCIAEISRDRVDEIRHRLPSLSHDRPFC
jgi:deaminated glutathione amidase